MRKLLLPLAAVLLVCLSSANASAAANFVYHEQTNNFVATPTCPSAGTDAAAGRYVENTDRSGSPGFQIFSPEKYTLSWKVEYQFFTDSVAVYYTTDGSTPTGNFGVGTGTTQVVKFVTSGTFPTTTTTVGEISYFATYQDQTQGCQVVDVVRAVIPPQPAGTTVKYIVSAWHHGGGEEVFANSGGTSCGPTCFKCHSGTTGCATVFEYSVVAPPATPLIISEFRLRGPNGEFDEFVEIYNASDSEVEVNAFDGSAGFGLAASDGAVRFTIPNGTKIPGRAHYLGVNSVGYSLGSYPASTRPVEGGASGRGDSPAPSAPTLDEAPPTRSGKILPPKTSPTRGQTPEPRAGAGGDTIPGPTASATPDVSYTTGIADNAGIALFNTADNTKFSTTTRLDAVGSTSELNPLYKEGAGYPALSVLNAEYSFYRDNCGKSGALAVFGQCTRSTPVDSDDNAADFIFVEVNGNDLGAGARIGAPGPENSTSPIQRNELFPGSVLFPCVPSSATPNRARNSTPDPTNNSTFGTLAFRIRITNNTGQNVTRLRFRVVDVSTFPASTVAPGTADLRARSAPTTVITNPCTSLPITLQGTTLEEPPTQSIGGGFNSSLSAFTVTTLSPIMPGATFDFHLLVGVEQQGRFKFYVNVEALP